MSSQLPDHLLAFQRDDVMELLTQPNRFVMEPMGAGKSVMAIAAAEALDAFTIVVVCPAILRADWAAKFARFGRNNYSYTPDGPGRRVITVSYEHLSSPERRDRLLHWVKTIDVLILDEAQRLKNIGKRANDSIYGVNADGTGLVAIAHRVWVMSGTLCENHVGELYTHLKALFPKLLPQMQGHPINYHGFLDRFTHWESTRWGVKVLGNRESEQMREIVKRTAITRTRDEIERELPPLTVATVPLARGTIDETAYEEFLQTDEGRELAALLPEIEHGGMYEETTSLAKARHRLGDLKANAVGIYARQLLLADPSMHMLVFAHHRSVLRRIAFDLRDVDPGVGLIDGETPEARRTELIERFQDRAMRLLVLGIGTAREGVTLTAANRVLFAEASWVPAHNDQAIHRAARIGQTRPVIAEFITVIDTLDEAVMRTCTRKTRLLNELFD